MAGIKLEGNFVGSDDSAAYLGGYHHGVFNEEEFQKAKEKAKNIFEELDVERKLKKELNILESKEPKLVTVSWYG